MSKRGSNYALQEVVSKMVDILAHFRDKSDEPLNLQLASIGYSN